MRTKSNASLLMQGFGNLVTGSDTVEGGLAQMILGWLPVLDTPIRWSVGEGAEAKSEVFTAAEYVIKPAANTKLQGFRLAAIGADLLGRPDDVEPLRGALKGNVVKTLRAAVAVRHFYGDKLRLITVLGHGGKKRSAIMGIPAGDMFDLLEKLPEGSEPKLNSAGRAVGNLFIRARSKSSRRAYTDAQLVAAVLSEEVACDGQADEKYGVTWSSVQFCERMFKRGVAAGLLPDAKSRNTGDDVGEHAAKTAQTVKNFSAKIEQVRDWLMMCNAPDGEVQIAPTPEQEAVLDVIAEQWAAYRSAHPILF